MANLKMINNLIAGLTHHPCPWRALLTDLTTESGSFWVEATLDCLYAISDRTNTVECCHMNFNLYI